MARKPNYNFERNEREKAKAAKVAERTKAKAEKSNRGGAVEPEAGAEVAKDERPGEASE